MSESKTNKDRKAKVDAFKEKAKEAAQQQSIPKTHLIPITDWKSTELLDFRGDLMDAMEQQLMLTFQSLQEARQLLNQTQAEFQKAAHVMQMVIQTNIKAGKIKLSYQWNNGEDASAEEVAKYEEKMNELRELQRKNFEAAQQQENAKKTGLVGADGSPIGTTQNLDEVTNQEEDEDSENSNLDAMADQSRAAADSNDDGQPEINEDAGTLSE